ncbi:AbrB/MazE/SpoVT family DNA-binding domain-containing protein [Aquincola tertiaricarbonis]|uniref:AbrB/MazE/SpoVT family DNA-binding domain-containing protein n=1 Tax=Aquincola tertiaricarbonis TaxID=391953 RepID=A0ABY4SC10_AQUTE|nr:AbrB/MazE/SpoVT family DNA-binding domain-containing protein [Aquincola tertiaricarbonis]URI08759.1 AbrB/MazE/SpoVT family DNA-binding domain-containing protein [Aquincola tertiaricarbonis]
MVANMRAIHVTLRSIGNSKGVALPQSVLAQADLHDATHAELTVENGVICLRKVTKPSRAGWAEAAKKIAAAGGDELVLSEFGIGEAARNDW